METCLYRLSFKGPVHFGSEGTGLEAVETYLSSDSLTSALINAASILLGPNEASRMMMALEGDHPPFILSSLFPFGPDPTDAEKTVEALIKPLVGPPLEGNREVLRKEWKRLRYLHPEDFLCCLKGRLLNESAMKSLLERSRNLTREWWSEDLRRPRVSLDRESQSSSIWNQAAIFFSREEKDESGKVKKKGSGLYGLIRFRDPSWKPFLEATFRLLGDTGLGGERTYGLGLFDFKGFEPPNDLLKKILEDPAERHVLLSVFFPREEEKERIADGFEAWEIRERRGYIVTGRNATTIKRRRMRVIVEGSVCRKVLRGALVDVTPENQEKLELGHRIIRSGLAFPVPSGGHT